MPSLQYGTVVIGGGFYGSRLALKLRRAGETVLLVERDSQLMARASLRNQARVHNGYHYPRSILTSLRSRLNYARFLDEYGECVDRSFPHYYAVARGMSKITAAQFVEFCRRIGAPLTPAPAAVKRLFDSSRIDSVFEVQECAFDAAKLRARMTADLEAAGVEVVFDTEAVSLARATWDGQGADVSMSRAGVQQTVRANLVLNCTYSRLNHLLARSGAATIPAKHELTEMALVEPPPALAGAAVTVMDGPFFSLMPYPSRGSFTLSHVRYTPQCSWLDEPGAPVADGDALLAGRESRFVHMVRDAQRYLPVMRDTRYLDSIWEVKTIMPRSEQDDSRPILLRRSNEHPACLTVLGAKLDSVYDVEDALARVLAAGGADRPLPTDRSRLSV
jgi:glycine/D-amino acid oxidase-like deaminating enzyme